MNESAFDKALRRHMQSAQDNVVLGLMGAATNVNATPSEPLTLDRLRLIYADFREKFGPTPAFLSSKLFPRTKAFQVANDSEQFTCAHPDFWLRVEIETKRNSLVADGWMPVSFSGMRILEIDLEEGMPPESRQYLLAIWDRLIEAVELASVDLPDWLKSAPRP